VSRLDVRTGQLQATIPITGHSSADDLAVGAGMVWVRSGNRLLPLDPATNTMTDRTGDWEVGGKHLTADAESLWVSSDSGRVTRIDMATNTVTGTLQVSDRAPAVAVGHGAVWIVDTARTALLRVQH
jgi:virginiamycin B lyase